MNIYILQMCPYNFKFKTRVEYLIEKCFSSLQSWKLFLKNNISVASEQSTSISF